MSSKTIPSSTAIPAAEASRITPKSTYAESNIVGEKMTTGKQLIAQAILLFITFTVLFPVLWVVSMSFDPRADVLRPTTLNLIPPGFSLKAYLDVIAQPTANPVGLATLALNSLLMAAATRLQMARA